ARPIKKCGWPICHGCDEKCFTGCAATKNHSANLATSSPASSPWPPVPGPSLPPRPCPSFVSFACIDHAYQISQGRQGVIVLVHGSFGSAVGAVFAVAVE